MKKTLIAMTSVLALAAGTIAFPATASALPVWVVPAIVAAGVGGLGVGAAATANATPRSEQVILPAQQTAAPVVVQGSVPAGCHFARARVGGLWQRIEICD
jgi:hypothetical protein